MTSCGDDRGTVQPYFLALPFSNDNFNNCSANGISDDGITVVGQCMDENAELEPVKWVDGKIERLGFMSNIPDVPKNAFALAISNNGIIVGNQGYLDLTPLGYYYINGKWEEIVDPRTQLLTSYPNSISSRGEVIVGLTGIYTSDISARAFYFRPSEGNVVTISSIFDINNKCSDPFVSCLNELSSVDGAGMIAVGYDSMNDSKQKVLQLVPISHDILSGQTAQLVLPASYPMGIAQGISRNGDIIAGGLLDPNVTLEATVSAVYWDMNHQPFNIGSLGPYIEMTQTLAYAASDTGVIVGESNGQAFIYESDNGMEALSDYLEKLNLGDKIKDWKVLMIAKAITPDGRYIVGTGRNAGNYPQAFLIFVP